jgi:hypothetical protein
MGNRANVLVKEDELDSGVYLYTHWNRAELPADLQKALAKRWRWNDMQYLTRIIFDVMTEGEQGKETGYGISAQVGDGDRYILEVNGKTQAVSFRGKSWPFEEYVALSFLELETIWE